MFGSSVVFATSKENTFTDGLGLSFMFSLKVNVTFVRVATAVLSVGTVVSFALVTEVS